MGGSGGACGVPYTTRFTMPAESPSRRGTANFWWRLAVGPVLLVTMSTEHNYTPGSEQHRWLEDTLRTVNRTDTPWVVVTGHRPMYSQEVESYDPTMIAALEPLLLAAEVDIAMWGHDHVYMRSCPIVHNGTCADANGTTSNATEGGGSGRAGGVAPVHVVCGTAGAFRDDIGTAGSSAAAPWVVTMEACEGCHHWGYCRFVANASVLTMEYVGYIGVDNATTAPPRVLDRYSITRRA